MADTEEGGTGDKQSSARAKAEARRRRILEASGERMDVVSGEVVKPAGEAGDGDDPAEKPVSASSRYAQARRRRFKKAAAAAEAKPDEAGGDGAAEGGSAADTTAEAEDKAHDYKPENEEPTADSATATADEGTEKKKYMGVAKMRRKMLAEKKKQEEQKATPAETEERRSPSGRKLGVPPSLSTVARSTVKQQTGPIILQLLTLLLLFLAGFGIGVQNSAKAGGHNEGIVVKRALSLQDNGVGALRLLGSGLVDEDSAKDARERLLDESAKLQDDGSGEDDEFEGVTSSDTTGTKPKGVDGKVANIDPLFRVDLDEVTSGPGFLMAAARIAVKFHRALMYLILVLPVSIVKSILILPQALLASPPILFFFSIVIRFIGRNVLGANVPDMETITGQDTEESKDILTTIMKTIKAQLSATFPKTFSAFTVIKDAKSDMFVVLCGFFLGLVLPVHLGGVPGGEEL